MAASPIFKSLSMADIHPTSLPTIFPIMKNYTHRCAFCFSPRFAALKLHLSSPPDSLLFPLKERKNHAVALVLKTSDWTQKEEEEEQLDDAPQFEEGNEWEEGGKETEAQVSDWEDEVGSEAQSGDERGFGKETYQEPPEDAKLFVGNLPYDIDSEQLAQLFEKAGIVEVAEVIYNRQTDQSRGFGFVTMSTVEEAEKAVEMLHRSEVSGRYLTVNKASPKESREERPPRVSEPSFTVYVGNLPWQVNDARLVQIFSEHGKVVDARVVCDRESGRSRGFGFVTMSSKGELEDAIAALDGQVLDGRALRINVAEERARRVSM